MKCQICKRTLTNPESIADGIGPECAGKYATGVAAAGSSVARIESLAGLNDAGVSRWIVVAKQAIGAGRLGEARRFIAAAERLAQTPAPLPVPAPMPAVAPVEASPEIIIAKTPRGTFDFRPPRKDAAFLEDFKRRVGKPLRCWNEFKGCWQVRAIDEGIAAICADLLRKYFPGYSVAITTE